MLLRYTLCDHIHQEKDGITFRRIVEVVPYSTVATYIAARRGVEVELDAASDLFVDIDPGTDYLAEKTSSQADIASFNFEEHVVACQDQRKSAIIQNVQILLN